MTVSLPDLAAMEQFGRQIAGKLRAGDVVALTGGLGAGKTTLARAIVAGLGHEGEVPSPSFAIIETYDPPSVRLPLVHADFYRLEDPAEAEEIGFSGVMSGPLVRSSYRAGRLYLSMHGACAGCPSSTATLRHGIQNLLRHYIPEVLEVRPVAA